MGAGGELTQAADKALDDSARVGARVHAADRWLAARVQRMIEPAAVRLELWDSSSTYAGSRKPIGDLLVGDGPHLRPVQLRRRAGRDRGPGERGDEGDHRHQQCGRRQFPF